MKNTTKGSSSASSSSRNGISLRKERVRSFGVRSGVKTGAIANTCTNNSEQHSCNSIYTAMSGSSSAA
jgi:hypothetical protein